VGTRVPRGMGGRHRQRRNSTYESRRSPHWLKMKCEASHEFVVGGFTTRREPGSVSARCSSATRRHGIRVRRQDRTGFDTKLLLELRARLDGLEIAARRSRRAKDCRASAPTGCARRSSSRSPSSSGRCTASCGTRGCCASATTRTRKKPPGSRRDHAPGEDPLPEDGITKGELAAYYEAVAPVMIPHIQKRPVTMERFRPGLARRGSSRRTCRGDFQGGSSA